MVHAEGAGSLPLSGRDAPPHDAQGGANEPLGQGQRDAHPEANDLSDSQPREALPEATLAAISTGSHVGL